MIEVILNDKCMHCVHKECHDGYNFCNQAMKENSFYKNAKLYKGLEVIQRPTYEELEKENAELNKKLSDAETDYDKMFWQKNELIQNEKGNLTKAKEIIREFVEWANWQGSNCPSFKSIQDKAEQFLKDSEEK